MHARWSAYAGVSMALAGGVVVKAMAQRPNFYSATVYLSQSSANLMILTNMVFVIACSLLLGLQKLLYGPLRAIEIEQLYEKAWFAVTETCLAMTIFRGSIGAWFLIMFFSLLAGKVWAWIGEARVETLEQQPPRDPKLFHTRLALSLGLSVAFNLSMLEFIVKEVMRMPKPDMMVMFGFEFAVLSIVSLSTALRYAINLSEIAVVRQQKAKRIDEIKRERREAAIRGVLDRALAEQTNNSAEEPAQTAAAVGSTGNSPTSLPTDAVNAARAADQQPVDETEVEVEGWEGKGRWVFYLDLLTDFLKLVVYLSFFFILLTFYGLPIHILRDVFMTCRSFIKRISDFIKYRNATRDMHARYPDANEQDFRREDVCIICREEMRPYEPPAAGERPNPLAERMRPKKLPCGHVLHFSCLRSWLERQQICPTCRTSVVPANSNRTADAAAGNAPAGADPHPPAAGGNGARGGVLRLGPLRIAVGAARGNIMGDLQQRLRDGEGQIAQQPPANNNGPQQYGFGIRWDGMRRRERRTHGHRSVQDQLSSLERQIHQEISSLGVSMAEVQLLRNMEAQLALLRRQRENLANMQQTARPADAAPVAASTATPTQLTGDSTARVGSANSQLPAGLTLPEGWTITPLSPTQVPPQNIPFQGLNMASVPGFPPANPLFPMHARPMPLGGQMAFQMPQQQPFHQAFPGQVYGPPQPQVRVQQQVPQSGPESQDENATMPSQGNEHHDLAEAMSQIANRGRSVGDAVQSQASATNSHPPPDVPQNDLNVGAPATQSPAPAPATVTTDNAHSESNAAPTLPDWGSDLSSNAIPTTTSASDLPRNAATSSANAQNNSKTKDGQNQPNHNGEPAAATDSSSNGRNPTVEDLIDGLD